MYIVDENRRAGRIEGGTYTPIPVPGLSKSILTYSTVSDCIVNTFSIDEENFIEVTFPTEDISWVLHEASGQWSNRQDNNGSRSRALEYVFVYGKTLAIDHTQSKVYEFSDTEYQDDGNSITRTIDSVLINSALFGVPDQNLTLTRTRIAYECSGSTSITVSCSRDNDIDTFAQSQSFTIDGSGVLTIHRFPGGKLREGIIRITTTSNTRCDILSLAVDATVQRDTND